MELLISKEDGVLTTHKSGELGRRCRCRTAPNLNNVIEQDHRFIKKRITAILGFRSVDGALRTIAGYEAMQCNPQRSDPMGFRKAMPSRNASSFTRSSASPRSSHWEFHAAVPPQSAICNRTSQSGLKSSTSLRFVSVASECCRASLK